MFIIKTVIFYRLNLKTTLTPLSFTQEEKDT